MKKFTIRLKTVKNLQGWAEFNFEEKVTLFECSFYAKDNSQANLMFKTIKEAYNIPIEIASGEFVLTED